MCTRNLQLGEIGEDTSRNHWAYGRGHLECYYIYKWGLRTPSIRLGIDKKRVD